MVDITKHLVIEKNAIAIEGTNTIPGPSGLLAKLVVVFEDGKEFTLSTDKTWVSSNKPEKSWNENGFVGGSGWKPVVVLGRYGMAPWGAVAVGGGGAKRPVRRPVKPPVAIEVSEEELKKPVYQAGVVFVGNDCGLNPNRQQIYVQNIRGTRGYFELTHVLSVLSVNSLPSSKTTGCVTTVSMRPVSSSTRPTCHRHQRQRQSLQFN